MTDPRALGPSLGDYLRVRRAMVSPADVGLPVTGRRRVPGLRREEVAELVGLSTDYYVRLEQGRADRPSDEVLDALSRGLRLGAAERAHLYDLARPARRVVAVAATAPGVTRVAAAPAAEPGEAVRPALRRVVEAIAATPAMIMNDRSDILVWNALAATLIADFPALAPTDRNMARQIFLGPDARRIHPDWDTAARTTAGILRLAAGRRPHDRQLVDLIAELSLGSAAFRELWASHLVHEKTHGDKRFRHPAGGEIRLSYETLHVPGPGRLMLVTYSPVPGSPDEAALRLLAGLCVSGAGPGRDRHALAS